MTCNYCFPTGTIFQINSEFLKKGTFRGENRTSCLVGLKTHPTIVPRSGIELTTSRLHSLIVAKVSHALNHSAIHNMNTRLFSVGFLPLGPLHHSVSGLFTPCYRLCSALQGFRVRLGRLARRGQGVPPGKPDKREQ